MKWHSRLRCQLYVIFYHGDSTAVHLSHREQFCRRNSKLSNELLQLQHSTLTQATLLCQSCLIASVIMSQCLPVFTPVRQNIRVCVWIPVPDYLCVCVCVCAPRRHHSWLLLACLPVSQTCQISFLCSITQNKSDELEIASAKLPSLSASCVHFSLASYGASNTISRRVHDIRWCAVLDVAGWHTHTHTHTHVHTHTHTHLQTHTHIEEKLKFSLMFWLYWIQRGVDLIVTSYRSHVAPSRFAPGQPVENQIKNMQLNEKCAVFQLFW